MLHASRFTFHVSRFTLHVLWLGWAGLGVALVLGVAASGAGVLAGVALIGAAGLRLGPGRGRWATPVAGIGWLALGGALLAILLPG